METKIQTEGDRPKQPHSAQVSQKRTWINNMQTHTSNFFQYIKWQAHRRIEIRERQHKHTHTHTHAHTHTQVSEFPCQCLRRGIGCVAARDQSDWFWLAVGPDFSHLSLVLFWMNTALEPTPPCAAFFFFFFEKRPFPFSPSVDSFCCLSFATRSLAGAIFCLSPFFPVVSVIISFFTCFLFTHPSFYCSSETFLGVLFHWEYLILLESPFHSPVHAPIFLFSPFFSGWPCVWLKIRYIPTFCPFCTP